MQFLKITTVLISILIGTMVSSLLLAQADQFKAGTAIPEYGKITLVPGMEPLPADTKFKVSFDIKSQAQAGKINRSLESAARFINMHVAAGVKAENIDLALVVHGGAVKDMAMNKLYNSITKKDNANAALVKALQAHGVKFYVCGQSATYYGVSAVDLLPGVKMSLSAMTAHGLLQQQGYSLNPF